MYSVVGGRIFVPGHFDKKSLLLLSFLHWIVYFRQVARFVGGARFEAGQVGGFLRRKVLTLVEGPSQEMMVEGGRGDNFPQLLKFAIL